MWDFRRSVPKISARKKGELGDQTTCQYMLITWNNVAFHDSQCSQSMVWHPFENDHSFLAPYSSFLNRIFLSLEMEGFWPSFTGPKVPPGSNGFWMPRHHSWIIPGRIRHIKRVFPKMSCERRYQVWCGWEHVAKRRRPGRLDYIYLFIYLFFSVGFSVCLFI